MQRFANRDVFVFASLLLISVSLPLGCGSGDSTTTTPGTGSGGELGPLGTTCTTFTACFVNPNGTAMPCPATMGPSPAVTPADFDYVLTALNAIRTRLGLPLFARTAALDTFAMNATAALAAGGPPHGYFQANPGTSQAENQTGPSWSPNTTSTQIDEIIACFMSEADDPPGFQKGHWQAIVCPCFTKIGVGLQKDGGGNLFMSLEFTE